MKCSYMPENIYRLQTNKTIVFFVNVSVIGDRQYKVQANWKGLWIVITRVAFLFRKEQKKKLRGGERDMWRDTDHVEWPPSALGNNENQQILKMLGCKIWISLWQ